MHLHACVSKDSTPPVDKTAVCRGNLLIACKHDTDYFGQPRMNKSSIQSKILFSRRIMNVSHFVDVVEFFRDKNLLRL